MGNYVLHAEPVVLNFSRVAFRMAARDYLNCFESYFPATFSPAKYFLPCLAIELALKALHLDLDVDLESIKNKLKFVKKLGHNLVDLYDGLETGHKILSNEEEQLLKDTNPFYDRYKDDDQWIVKSFEYIRAGDAAKGYSEFPDLDKLHRLASKLVEHVEQHQANNP
jgi:hypothetical protein